MKSINFFMTTASLILAFTVACSAQQVEGESPASATVALSTANFDGASEWKVYAPGELTLDNESLHNLRIVYGAEMLTPNGQLKKKVSFEIRDVMAAGRKADWIQWLFTSEKGGVEDYPNLDVLVIDSQTGQLRYRMFPAGPTVENGGTYSFIRISPDALSELTVMADGKTYPEAHELNGVPVFDFASLGFILPFLELHEGQGLRLRNYNFSTVGSVAVYPHALRKIRLPSGREVNIRNVDVLVGGGVQMITYKISKDAPYFYGWEYRQIKDGATLFKMDYRGFVPTGIEGEL